MTALETAWKESTYEERKSFVKKICSSHFSIVREELLRKARGETDTSDLREEINEEAA